MNLPNKLTVIRVALIPVFLVFLLVDTIPNNFLWALLTFAVASITDFVDGKIARSQNLVTDFGKFLDPLADKLLVFSALVVMIGYKVISAVVVLIIIFRETAVNGLRSIAAAKGAVIAANMFGKVKTAVQMFSICISLAALAALELFPALAAQADAVRLGLNILWWAVGAYTAFTLFVYFKLNGKFIDPNK